MNEWLILDLETTGLDPSNELLCEVGYIHLKERNLNEICCDGSYVISGGFSKALLDMKGHEFVKDMHMKSGLYQALDDDDDSWTTAEVDRDLSIKFEDTEEIILIGNTISFDRSFINIHMPKFAKKLHYRSIDVSSVKLLVERFDPLLFDKKPKSEARHRALADCYDSWRELKYYVDNLLLESQV